MELSAIAASRMEGFPFVDFSVFWARHWQKSQLACFHCVSVLTLLLSNKYLNLGRAGKLVKITGEGRPVETRLATVLVVETNAVLHNRRSL